MRDDDKDKMLIISTPRQAGRSYFYDLYKKKLQGKEPAWVGVDWAKDSGMNRGDVIKRSANVAREDAQRPSAASCSLPTLSQAIAWARQGLYARARRRKTLRDAEIG